MGIASLSGESGRPFWLTAALQSSFARGHVVSLLYGRVLRSSVEVSHTPLQRRALINRTAACERKARIGDAVEAPHGHPPFGRILALVANRDCSVLTPRAAGTSADRPALHRRARTSGLPISNRGSAGTVNLAARPLAEAHRGG
jgi:hypothetical protein